MRHLHEDRACYASASKNRASRPSLSSCRRTVSSVPPGRRHGAALSAYGSLLRHGSKPTIQPSFPSETLAGGAHNHWKPTYRSYVTQLAAHLPPGPPYESCISRTGLCSAVLIWSLVRSPLLNHLALGGLWRLNGSHWWQVSSKHGLKAREDSERSSQGQQSAYRILRNRA